MPFHVGSNASTNPAASQFLVQAGDLVFVGAPGVTRWNRFVSQLLPVTTLLNNSTNARLSNQQTHSLGVTVTVPAEIPSDLVG